MFGSTMNRILWVVHWTNETSKRGSFCGPLDVSLSKLIHGCYHFVSRSMIHCIYSGYLHFGVFIKTKMSFGLNWGFTFLLNQQLLSFQFHFNFLRPVLGVL